MATISNQATLNYKSGTDDRSAASNTATVTLQGPLEITKQALESSYQLGDTITYNVFIRNTSPSVLSTVVLTDSLGTFQLSDTVKVTPLTYLPPSRAFVDQRTSREIYGTVTSDNATVVFGLGNINPGSTVMLQYKARVNEYARAIVGTSTIDNIAVVTADGASESVRATFSLPVAAYASLEIEKAMSPDPIVDGSPLTYTFELKNSGTIDATDVVLRDVFSPVPTITSVTDDNGVTTDYSYTSGVFRYPALASTAAYTVKAATFTVNATTGVVTVVPGTSKITVVGTI